MDEHLKQVSEVVREEQVDIQAEPSNKTDWQYRTYRYSFFHKNPK
jgi:hypothetical protein